MIRFLSAQRSSLMTPSCPSNLGPVAMLNGRDYGLPDPLLQGPDGGLGERPAGLSELAATDGVLCRGGLSFDGFVGQQLTQQIQRIRQRRSGRYTCATVPRED
ncbi:MAG: hypothetical protein IGS50_13560 [Synechococcales cyanobacterium C42_A2020_086]|jgi:hypothetical protein|nr:hypothetical protein [Synechococcales cyanobacterium M58_A2018_015]MBF2074772.1 hypothetical protein [Synechococcales cyanobacterium C42_A2020_086]